MRRFEFVEGGSSKFWQIELEGTQFTVQWGKIGTAGQSQVKEFPSEAKALAEHDKLVAEKLKKGYVETGAAAAGAAKPVAVAKAPDPSAAQAAPSPAKPLKTPRAKAEPAAEPVAPVVATAPASSAAPVVPEEPAEIDWKGLAEMLPPEARVGHRNTHVPLVALDETSAATWMRLQKNATQHSPKAPAALQAAYDEAVAWTKAPAPGPLSPEAAAIAYYLCAFGFTPSDLALNLILGESIFAKAGVRGLVDAALASRQILGATGYVQPNVAGLTEFTLDASNSPVEFRNLANALAWYVRTLDDAQYAAVCAEAEARWPSLVYGQRLSVLAMIPGHTPLADQLAEEWLASDGQVTGYVKPSWGNDGLKPDLKFHYSLPLLLRLAKKGVSMAFSGGFLVSHLGVLLDLHELGVMPLVKMSNDNVDWGGGVITGLQVAALAPSNACAELMVSHLTANKDAAAFAGQWLDAHPRLALPALAAAAAGAGGLADRAATRLLKLDRTHAGLLDTLTLTPAARAAVTKLREKMAPRPEANASELPAVLASPPWESGKKPSAGGDPRDNFPAKLPKLPAWFSAEATYRPLLKGREKSLSPNAVKALVTMLAFTTPEAPYAGIDDVKTACDRASLEEFAWTLFNEWLVAGASSKEGWVFQQLGVLGGDDVARKLTPLIRAWPGESQHARAVSGLDVLARIGSDLALMHLNGVAQKIKFKGLQEKAREKMNEVAARRGLSADELADRLVPDLDLDADGSLTLDFGPRQFRVGFNEALVPFVKDASGKLLTDLPKPNKSDDATVSKESEATWKTLKKDAKAIASIQVTRFELAMCGQRRWEADSWRAMFLEHPLLVHLVRRLVWGVYDGANKLVGTFRVAEDGTLSNAGDELYTLPDEARVGIVHALDLSEEQRGAWGQILGDYGIVQPFAQIGRDTYAPTKEESATSALMRRKGQFVATGKVLGLVEQRGWRKGQPQDAGWIWEWLKPLPGNQHASLELRTGIGADMQMTEPKQELGGLSVSAKLGELSPVVFSELVRDLVQLGSA